MQDHFVEGDAGFNFQIAVIVDADVALVGALGGDRDAKFIFYITFCHALQPSGAGDGGETFSQEVGDGAPLRLIIFRAIFRQAHDAGADAVFGR